MLEKKEKSCPGHVREALMSKKKRNMLRQICLLSIRHLAFFTKNESVKMQNSFGQTFSNGQTLRVRKKSETWYMLC